MDIVGFIADITGIIGAIAAIGAWIQVRRNAERIEAEQKRLDQPIHFSLALKSDEGEKIRRLPVRIRRRELSRAEVLGRLGMIPMRDRGKRFSLDYLVQEDFLLALEHAQDAEGEFVVQLPASQKEFEQFDIDPHDEPISTAPLTDNFPLYKD